jgi:hypothetical protein
VKRYGLMWLAVGLLLSGLILLLDRLAPAIDVIGLARDWWPLVIVAVGAVSALHLRTRLGVARGPVLFALLGLVILVALRNPLPAAWRPALLPLAMCAIGAVILITLLVRAPAGGPRPVERVFLLGQGRRIPWRVTEPTVLAIRALAGGSIVTVADGSTAKAGRLEVTAILSDVEVIVPDGWTVFIDSPRASTGRLHGVPTAPTATAADLQIHAFSLLGKVDVRTPQQVI